MIQATVTHFMFNIWLGHVKALNLAKSDRGAGRLIGVNPQSVSKYRHNGTPSRAVDLACAAVLKGIAPYGELEPRTEREAAE